MQGTITGFGRARWGTHVALAAAVVAGAAAATPLAAAPAPDHRGPAGAPRHGVGRGTSTNWSGYAATGTNATAVTATWTQPTATCAPGEDSWSSPWVGIDGWSSTTVEQIGTDSDCVGGTPTYYGWYEMYPKALVTIPSVAVSPGHTYRGTVRYTGSGYAMTLTDVTTGATFTTTQTLARAKRTSVEWVMEGPSRGLLTNFGSVAFSQASATIGGRTATVDGLGSQSVTMVTSGGASRAVPGPASGGAFSVSWVRS